MSRKTLVAFLTLVVLAAPLAGCLKSKEEAPEPDLEQQRAERLLGETGNQRIVDAAALIPKNYTFPGQALLPPVTEVIQGRIGTEAIGAYEGQRDEGGIEYNTVIHTYDIAKYLPPGQPAEVVLRVFWDGNEGNSADLDILVDVPGTKTRYSGVTEDFNWNLVVKTMVVNTIGVPGQNHLVGVQAAGGLVLQGFDYELTVEVTYVKDVLTPYHPWAFHVPAGASGIILESEKAGGDEHITSQFIVIAPDDSLVQFIDFNDIDIPTESVFIPTKNPGQYIFYAYFMHGGFFRLKADSPLERFDAVPLSRVESTTALTSSAAPGVAGKDYLSGTITGIMPADDVNPTKVAFDAGGTFPLRVTAYIKGQAHPMAKVTLKSPLGEVHKHTVVVRYEDERGSIGYTSSRDNGPNSVFTWSNIAKGSWSAELVNNGPATEIGYTILTYTR